MQLTDFILQKKELCLSDDILAILMAADTVTKQLKELTDVMANLASDINDIKILYQSRDFR